MKLENGINVKCEDLSKKYGKKLALDNIDLSLGGGHIIGLLGPNGSGKTTLLKLISGLLAPTSGKIYVNDKAIGVDTKKIIAYLPDKICFDGGEKVEDAIVFFKDFFEDFVEDKARNMCKTLNIDTTSKFRELSKGTKEKVLLVLTMSRSAQLYVLDEPIAGVDPAARQQILSLILGNYNPDGTILISTHLITDVENILDQVIFIQDGKIKLNESVDEIREKKGMSLDALFKEVFACSEN